MKRFIIKLILFLIPMAIIDYGFGIVMSSAIDHTSGGETKRKVEISTTRADDILIFGSSRALFHYDTTILADSLGMSAYNFGECKNGILYAYPTYMLNRSRHIPKIVIYDIKPDYDFLWRYGRRLYMDPLREMYDIPLINDYMAKICVSDWVLNHSNFYRYNRKFSRIIGDMFNTEPSGINGYTPLHKVMRYELPGEPDAYGDPIDPDKLHLLEALVAQCRADSTELFFVVSPWYGYHPEDQYAIAKELAERYGYDMWIDVNDPDISLNHAMFHNQSHLNHFGAEAFTRKLAGRIKSRLNKKSSLP